MSQRIDRVNQLLQREVSQQLHQRFQTSAVSITISSVETASDLRHARIYYSVLGDALAVSEAEALFRKLVANYRGG